jgi:hypothetical protein
MHGAPIEALRSLHRGSGRPGYLGLKPVNVSLNMTFAAAGL